tara:strand:+ start:527 stop:916 length:390 start_codon:yes stop_codon:yes gene_type:complete
MIGTTLSGITFVNWNEVDINLQDKVNVREHKEYSDNEIALSVHLESGKKIGYIPLLSTIEKWGKKAAQENNSDECKYLRDKYIGTSAVRDNIINDMYRNNISVEGVVSRIITDDVTGDIKSIGVSFDYM